MYIKESLTIAEASQINVISLAYVGDAIYEMLVREKMMCEINCSVSQLHKLSKGYVCAKGQSSALELIANKLSDIEANILRRGRNANSKTVSKNADILEYRRATGLESLFGFLYLTGQDQRLSELFEIIAKKE